MKKFWLFAGDDYYPHRALGDFKGVYDSREDVIKVIKEYASCDWVRVVEVEGNEPVCHDVDLF